MKSLIIIIIIIIVVVVIKFFCQNNGITNTQDKVTDAELIALHSKDYCHRQSAIPLLFSRFVCELTMIWNFPLSKNMHHWVLEKNAGSPLNLRMKIEISLQFQKVINSNPEDKCRWSFMRTVYMLQSWLDSGGDEWQFYPPNKKLTKQRSDDGLQPQIRKNEKWIGKCAEIALAFSAGGRKKEELGISSKKYIIHDCELVYHL